MKSPVGFQQVVDAQAPREVKATVRTPEAAGVSTPREGRQTSGSRVDGAKVISSAHSAEEEDVFGWGYSLDDADGTSDRPPAPHAVAAAPIAGDSYADAADVQRISAGRIASVEPPLREE